MSRDVFRFKKPNWKICFGKPNVGVNCLLSPCSQDYDNFFPKTPLYILSILSICACGYLSNMLYALHDTKFP